MKNIIQAMITIITLLLILLSCIPEADPDTTIPLPSEIDLTYDGGTITSGITAIDYGKVFGGTPVDITFTIINDGSGDLLLSGDPLIDLSGDPIFSVLVMPPAIIPAKTRENFVLRCTSDGSSSTKANDVTIINNDEDEGIFIFTVSAMNS